MSILLTGSNGFIGNEIRSNDDFKNQHEILLYESLPDIRKAKKSKDLKLIHLAGKFFGKNREVWEGNVEFTRKLLEQFNEHNLRKVLFLSTGAVYGKVLRSSGSREQDREDPSTYYGLTKLLTEKIIINNFIDKNIKYYILRLPNVYGLSQKKGVVYEFSKQIQEGRNIKIKGNGKQERDFLHISDLIRALLLFINTDANSGIYNISSSLTLSVENLANKLIGNKNIKKVFLPGNDNLNQLILDYSLAEKVIGYKPLINNLKLI